MERTGGIGPWSRAAWLLLVVLAAVAPVVVASRAFPVGSPDRDDAGYLSQANALRAGHLTLSAADHDPFFLPFLSGVDGDRVVFKYQPAWPALIAASEAVTGTPKVALALTGAASALAVAALAFEVTRRRRAALAAGFVFATSPWFLVQSGTYLAYPASTALLCGGTALVLRAARTGSSRLWVAAGAVMALGVFHRPYDAVLGLLPVAVWFVATRRRSGTVRRDVGWIALGAAPFALLFFAYNRAVTGKFFTLAFSLVGPNDRFGFGLRSSLADPGEPGFYDFTPGEAWRTVLAFAASLTEHAREGHDRADSLGDAARPLSVGEPRQPRFGQGGLAGASERGRASRERRLELSRRRCERERFGRRDGEEGLFARDHLSRVQPRAPDEPPSVVEGVGELLPQTAAAVGRRCTAHALGEIGQQVDGLVGPGLVPRGREDGAARGIHPPRAGLEAHAPRLFGGAQHAHRDRHHLTRPVFRPRARRHAPRRQALRAVDHHRGVPARCAREVPRREDVPVECAPPQCRGHEIGVDVHGLRIARVQRAGVGRLVGAEATERGGRVEEVGGGVRGHDPSVARGHPTHGARWPACGQIRRSVRWGGGDAEPSSDENKRGPQR